MIVCLCKAVSHTEVDAHVARGCRTVRDVGRACGAGTDCGACVGDIVDRLEAGATRRRQASAQVATAMAAK